MAGRATYELVDGIATITLDDPKTRNALDLAMAADVRAALTRAADEARVVVLTGANGSFCSGANVMTVMPTGAEDAPDPIAFMAEHFDPVMSGLRDLPIPLVVVVSGPAVGFGAGIALMGDLIVAADSAYFQLSFRGIGLGADGGVTYTLPRMLSRVRAMELLLLGRRLPAAKALDWGLVNEVWPEAELAGGVAALVADLGSGPKSLGLVRREVWGALDREWTEQLTAEALMQGAAVQTEDFREGVLAFKEKRKPVFRGK